jgi:hypothetical protein
MTINDTQLIKEMTKCQNYLHSWGNANQVSFDPNKESFHILHPKSKTSGSFTMLGITFDIQLKMEQGICEIAAKGHTRLSMLLRCRRFYSREYLLRLYKSLVLSGIEFATPALYHCSEYALRPLETIQERLSKELGFGEVKLLMQHSLAPFRCRRDIAMLGLLHRIMKGWAPNCFNKFIYSWSGPSYPRSLRAPHLRHNPQIHDPSDGTESRLMNRSIFGLIYAYNCLPQVVVDSCSISISQRHLQRA